MANPLLPAPVAKQISTPETKPPVTAAAPAANPEPIPAASKTELRAEPRPDHPIVGKFDRSNITPFFTRTAQTGCNQAEAVIFLIANDKGEIGLAVSRHNDDINNASPLCSVGRFSQRQQIHQIVERLAGDLIFPKAPPPLIDTGKLEKRPTHGHASRNPEMAHWLRGVTLAVHQQEWTIGKPLHGVAQPNVIFNYIVLDGAAVEEKIRGDAAALKQTPPAAPVFQSIADSGGLLNEFCAPTGIPTQLFVSAMAMVPHLIRSDAPISGQRLLKLRR